MSTDIEKALPWSPAFAFEVALSFEPAEVLCEKFNITLEEYEIIKENPLFIREVAEHAKVIKETGVTLSTKAALSLESMMPKLVQLFNDDTVPAASRIAAFEKVANIANIKDNKDDTPTLSFNFQFDRNGQPKIVEGKE